MTIVANLRQIYNNYYATMNDAADIRLMDNVYGDILQRKANQYLKALFDEEELVLQTRYPHLFEDTKGDIYRRPKRF